MRRNKGWFKNPGVDCCVHLIKRTLIIDCKQARHSLPFVCFVSLSFLFSSISLLFFVSSFPSSPSFIVLSSFHSSFPFPLFVSLLETKKKPTSQETNNANKPVGVSSLPNHHNSNSTSIFIPGCFQEGLPQKRQSEELPRPNRSTSPHLRQPPALLSLQPVLPFFNTPTTTTTTIHNQTQVADNLHFPNSSNNNNHYLPRYQLVRPCPRTPNTQVTHRQSPPRRQGHSR